MCPGYRRTVQILRFNDFIKPGFHKRHKHNPLTGDQTYLGDLMNGNCMHEQISIDFQKEFE